MEKIKLLLIDDHSIVREGLKQLLELDGDIKVVGEASEGKQGLALIESLKPDIVLLDLDMPGMNGIDVLKKLKEKKSKQKVIILTIHNEIEYLQKAMEIGVSGYTLKDSEYAVLRKAILSVNVGENFIDSTLTPALKEKEYSKKVQKENENSGKLSIREMDVLCYLAEGLYNKEIASNLKISEKTVKNHVSNIFKKIGVSDRTQAAVYAIKHSYVELK